jgi:aminoglycoside/choline kinase family phosphotransferase
VTASPAAVGTPFPRDPGLLTPSLLESALRDRWPGVVVDEVVVVATKRCGDGVASTADRVMLELAYGPGTQGPLPERLVLKTMMASPRAPAAMYENEVRFYRELRDGLDLEAPNAFATSYDPGTGRFGLLLEDLGARSARFPSALDHVTIAEVSALLGHLATLHATFWESPRFGSDLAWLSTPTSGGMFEVFDLIGFELIADQVARHPFKAELIAPLGRSLEELWELLWVVQQDHAAEPTTLLHGDTHVGNTYLLPGGTGGFLDWQLMMRGSWAHDVIYLMVTALEPAVRRAEQHRLLEGYLSRLEELGVPDVPALDEAFLACRRAALWGLVIGWLICPPENYGAEITIANISRAVAAVTDLDTLPAIGSR